MLIKYLQLLNYRNYSEIYLELNKNVNVFIGDNAQGKTNILESIYFCSIGKSQRTNKDKELIKWDCDTAFIKVFVCKDSLDKKIEVKIFKEGKKGININSIKVRKISELMGVFQVVMFSPEDLKIVKESPSYRRKFLNIELCKLDKKYYYSLVQYSKVLNERNIILRNWRNERSDLLDIYDSQLSKYGAVIIKTRERYIHKLNTFGKQIHKDISNDTENIEFEYITCVDDYENIEKQLLELYGLSRKVDIDKRITSKGPQRDDFSILINSVDTRIYGSQGQQRTAVLTIKFASLHLIKELTGEYPVLLLDDVLSELDINRQKYILNSIKDMQTIITCTGIGDIKSYLKCDSQIFLVKDGVIKQL